MYCPNARCEIKKDAHYQNKNLLMGMWNFCMHPLIYNVNVYFFTLWLIVNSRADVYALQFMHAN